MTNVNSIPEADLQPLITALAEAKCQCILAGLQPLSTCVCNGSGHHPLTELLRVKCLCDCHIYSGWKAHWLHARRCGLDDDGEDCTVIRPATPEEAEAVGLKLLEAMAFRNRAQLEQYCQWYWDPESGTLLKAVLNDLAQVVGIGVPA